ncbi:MAG TPA: restriction endonuclease [Burkholderiales bacterium]|nr:restriction endonuclease [Burkholderiales bacterium]
MLGQLASRPRIVQALFAAVLVLGFPLAIALPRDLNGKVYASGAVVLIAAAAAILAAALVRRWGPFDASRAAAPHGARDDPSRTGSWSLDLLRQLEWRRFEELCAAYFAALGFTARETHSGADGGADISLIARDAQKPSIVVQCKGWNVFTVGIKPVRELRAAMAAANVLEGVMVTSGTFTQEAKEFSRSENIHLIDGNELLRKMGSLVPEQSEALLKLATAGDFFTPTCPACGIKMAARTSSTEGRKFWGCLNYPRCKRTFFGAANAPA